VYFYIGFFMILQLCFKASMIVRTFLIVIYYIHYYCIIFQKGIFFYAIGEFFFKKNCLPVWFIHALQLGYAYPLISVLLWLDLECNHTTLAYIFDDFLKILKNYYYCYIVVPTWMSWWMANNKRQKHSVVAFVSLPFKQK